MISQTNVLRNHCDEFIDRRFEIQTTCKAGTAFFFFLILVVKAPALLGFYAIEVIKLLITTLKKI